ncbi:MAG TPA: SDR family oxidoreductase [Actinomycetota bacterium]|jgi:3-oxoacyl-[acyl-carrier protein] reductase|nr:SDR family oxidoreductase [Actinomycetota bacterium]
MDLGLKGRPALVAAASKGLGRACAVALAREGAAVGICGRDEGNLKATRDEIAEETGATVVAIPANVSQEEDAVRFIREGAEALGGCQILVPNAGGPPTGRFDDLSDDDFKGAFELNFLSTVRMTREALPLMRDAGYGRVVVIGSLAIKQPLANLMLSNAIRAGMAGWARTLADEVAPAGITLNVVLPGRIYTDRVVSLLEGQAEREGRSFEEVRESEANTIPLQRFGDPRELGDVVAFLASERASYLTGCFIQIDGGMYRGLL